MEDEMEISTHASKRTYENILFGYTFNLKGLKLINVSRGHFNARCVRLYAFGHET